MPSTVIALRNGELLYLDADPAMVIASRISAKEMDTGWWTIAGHLLRLADVDRVVPAHWLDEVAA